MDGLGMHEIDSKEWGQKDSKPDEPVVINIDKPDPIKPDPVNPVVKPDQPNPANGNGTNTETSTETKK